MKNGNLSLEESNPWNSQPTHNPQHWEDNPLANPASCEELLALVTEADQILQTGLWKWFGIAERSLIEEKTMRLLKKPISTINTRRKKQYGIQSSNQFTRKLESLVWWTNPTLNTVRERGGVDTLTVICEYLLWWYANRRTINDWL